MSIIRKQIDNRKALEKATNIEREIFGRELKRHPMIYIGLIGSGFLTMLAGVFIGVAPHKVADASGQMMVRFFANDSQWAMFIGLFFAVLYGVTFPVIGEYGTYFWHKKAELREPDNRWQTAIAYSMFVITLVFTVITSIAASVILASLLGTFDIFQRIPDWAQSWTVTIIPVGLLLHAVSNIFYRHVSKTAEELREIERTLQEIENEADMQIRQAKLDARKAIAVSQAATYTEISKSEAQGIGKTKGKAQWSKDKMDLGAVVDEQVPGFDSGGAPAPAPTPAPAVQAPEPPKPSTKNWNPPTHR